MPSAEGNLTWLPAADHLDLVAAPVAAALTSVPGARVASIDPTLAAARRGDVCTLAAVMVLATDRADINRVVRRHLGARKISFADQAATQLLTGMQQGGITPVGLPAAWPILVDEGVVAAGPVIIGAGVRAAKLLVDGAALAGLPNAETLALASERP